MSRRGRTEEVFWREGETYPRKTLTSPVDTEVLFGFFVLRITSTGTLYQHLQEKTHSRVIQRKIWSVVILHNYAILGHDTLD